LARTSSAENPPDGRALLIALVILAAGIALIASLTDAVFDFAAQLKSSSPPVQYLDRSVHDWCVTHRSTAGNLLFTAITQLGSPVSLSIVAAIAAFVLWRRGHRVTAAFIVFATVCTWVIDVLLKDHYSRAHPLLTQALIGAHGYSFPSGHALGSSCILGIFAYLAVRGDQRARVKVLACIAALLFVTLICWSRVYLGVHWLTDVLAGAALGVALLCVLICAREALIFARRFQPRM
jgi:undecaprenyl-diphosphatase